MQDGGRTLSVLTGRTERDLMGWRGCFAQDAVRQNVEGRGLGGGGDRRSGGNGVRGGENDRWEGGAAIKQWRRLRRPEAAATAATAGKRH